MAARCVALLSGGLDSMLAIRIVQAQGVEVEAFNFQSVFTFGNAQAAAAAHSLGVRLTLSVQDDDYFQLLRQPRFGYGRAANPCVDCRIYMLTKARQHMERTGAAFLVSGEVVGQRPMGQNRRDLDLVALHAECEDLLLRPLSAKLFPPTLPERMGWVARDSLYGFQGRGRKPLIELATVLGLCAIPSATTGCALTEPLFANKVFDLMEHSPQNRVWEFALLRIGRHFRLDRDTKVVVGRDDPENERLAQMHRLPQASSTALLSADNFNGPRALVLGPPEPAALDFAAGLILRYARRYDPENALVLLEERTETRRVRALPNQPALAARTLSTP